MDSKSSRSNQNWTNQTGRPYNRRAECKHSTNNLAVVLFSSGREGRDAFSAPGADELKSTREVDMVIRSKFFCFDQKSDNQLIRALWCTIPFESFFSVAFNQPEIALINMLLRATRLAHIIRFVFVF